MADRSLRSLLILQAKKGNIKPSKIDVNKKVTFFDLKNHLNSSRIGGTMCRGIFPLLICRFWATIRVDVGHFI